MRVRLPIRAWPAYDKVLSVIMGTALIVLGLASFSYGILYLRQPPPRHAAAAQQVAPTQAQHMDQPAPVSRSAAPPRAMSASKPVSVRIPSIGIDSTLTYTGLNADGSPAVPTGAHVDQAAWLTTSVTPGETGTAVILGHVDTAKSGPSVFYNLGKLTSGQVVYVTREDASTAVFTVNDVETYDKQSFPSDTVYGSADAPALRLITCAGSWDASSHQYTKNIVAFASLTGVR